VILKAIFWASLGGLAWTHLGYPVAAAALRRVREREVARDEITPSVALIVPALILVFLGCMQFGLAFFSYEQVASAANAAAPCSFSSANPEKVM